MLKITSYTDRDRFIWFWVLGLLNILLPKSNQLGPPAQDSVEMVGVGILVFTEHSGKVLNISALSSFFDVTCQIKKVLLFLFC